MEIITNHHAREVLSGHDLTPDERKEFEYLDWEKIEKGESTASFFRYKGNVYDLNDGFETTSPSAGNEQFMKWDLYQPDSFFSGILLKWAGDPWERYEYVIVGRYYT